MTRGILVPERHSGVHFPGRLDVAGVSEGLLLRALHFDRISRPAADSGWTCDCSACVLTEAGDGARKYLAPSSGQNAERGCKRMRNVLNGGPSHN
eukprot:15460926-Alexandrium_andersonii.AAC.1